MSLALSFQSARLVMSPAGMEPAGAVRHGRSPEGVEARARRNQSNQCFECLWHYHFSRRALLCPRREWSPRERSDMDVAPKGSRRGRAEINPTSALNVFGIIISVGAPCYVPGGN